MKHVFFTQEQSLNFFFFLTGSRASMFTFKSSSVEEEGPERTEEGATEKELEDMAAIMAERILQVYTR